MQNNETVIEGGRCSSLGDFTPNGSCVVGGERPRLDHVFLPVCMIKTMTSRSEKDIA